MKHYSPSVLTRAVSAAALLTEGEVMARLRSELDGSAEGKRRLAKRLGINSWRLSSILRGLHPLPDAVASTLGYRRVVRFEKIAASCRPGPPKPTGPGG